MEHFVSDTCKGEFCGPCFRVGPKIPATHKLGEEIAPDDTRRGHNLTQYVCCFHFGLIVGRRSAEMFNGCSPADLSQPDAARTDSVRSGVKPLDSGEAFQSKA